MRSISILSAALGAATLLTWSTAGHAQSIVRNDQRHPKYAVELEPHGALGWMTPPGDAYGVGIGGGVRASILAAPQGLIPRVNDTVAIGIGADLLYYGMSEVVAGNCAEYVGTGANRICVRVDSAGGPGTYLYLPATFQWSFYLTEKWSVFAEPGIGTFFQFRELDGSVNFGVFPLFQLGGRYHFSDKTTLTLRAGYPYLSVGVSFFL